MQVIRSPGYTITGVTIGENIHVGQYRLTIYIGDPQRVAAMTPSCRNLANPKSAKTKKSTLNSYSTNSGTYKTRGTKTWIIINEQTLVKMEIQSISFLHGLFLHDFHIIR